MRGTTKHNRQQIKDELDRLKAVGRVTGSATSASASIDTTGQNLPEVLKLIAEILREPALSQDEFEQLKREILTSLESGRSEPLDVASRQELRVADAPDGDLPFAVLHGFDCVVFRQLARRARNRAKFLVD